MHTSQNIMKVKVVVVLLHDTARVSVTLTSPILSLKHQKQRRLAVSLVCSSLQHRECLRLTSLIPDVVIIQPEADK